MSKSNTLETAILELLLNATAFANIADNAAASPLTNVYLSLHTADPTDAGNQTSNECAYTSYARVAVARTSGGWTVAAGQAENAAAVSWPQATGGSETATHFGLGTDASGAGRLLYSGQLGANLAISNGITPTADPGDIVITED